MIRLLFLGNSHIAALRRAWADNPARWPFAATFWGAHRGLLLETECVNGRLTATGAAQKAAFAKVNGTDTVDLDVDLIVLCGCLVSIQVAATLWRDARWPGLPSLQAAADVAALRETVVSQAAAHATLVARVDERLGLRLVHHLRGMTHVPIVLLSQPAPSGVVQQVPRPETRALGLAAAMGDGAALADFFDAAAAEAAHAAGADWRPQPPGTRQDHLFTRPEFMRAAPRLTRDLASAQRADDIMHGNAAYGRAALDDLAAWLRG